MVSYNDPWMLGDVVVKDSRIIFYSDVVGVVWCYSSKTKIVVLVAIFRKGGPMIPTVDKKIW